MMIQIGIGWRLMIEKGSSELVLLYSLLCFLYVLLSTISPRNLQLHSRSTKSSFSLLIWDCGSEGVRT